MTRRDPIGRCIPIPMTVEVAGMSMWPTYRHGDWLLTLRNLRPRAGAVVVARDPRDQDRLMVKRAVRRSEAGWWIEGDWPERSTDSRTFGPVHDRFIVAVVVARYWPVRLAGVDDLARRLRSLFR